MAQLDGVSVTPVFVPDRVLAADPFTVGVWLLAATGSTRADIVEQAMERGASRASRASRALYEHEVDRALTAAQLVLPETEQVGA